ncbi:MAG: hypothetical protein JOZ90_03850 [Alphaproteobacteria bacterium]|nr:hypothetical protein [Alphaproteobacteria bacterium]MBV9372779.1 hypothetical protein [Alphaproteobacteria bacterium]MBV9900214.1 hypothetical protein [Alphaproteobacteria bacterium]
MKRFADALLLLSLALLSACAEPGPYPSLAQRPAERAYAEEAAREPVAAAPLPDDPAVAGRIDALLAEGERGEAEFAAAFAPAAAAASRAGAAGSDSWVEAQQALSRATAAQERTGRALGDLDQFALARAGAGPLSEADQARLRRATEALQAAARAQAARIERLEATLRR